MKHAGSQGGDVPSPAERRDPERPLGAEEGRDRRLPGIAETALREGEERFRVLFRSSPMPYALSDLETGVFLDANEAFLRLYGYRRDEVIGHTAAELGMFRDPEARGRIVSRLATYGEARETALQMMTRGREVRDILFTATKVSLGGRDVLLGVLLDQTDRLRAEREFRFWKERYERVSEASRMIFYDVCPEGDRIQWSRSAAGLLGLASGNEAGGLEALFRLVHPEDRGRMEAVLEEARTRPGPFEFRHRIRRADGSWLLLQNRGFPMRDEETGRLHLVGVAEDVTERRRLEEQLLQARKMEAVGRLAGGVAHDFNNMIGVITGFATLLAERMGPEDPMRADVQEILAAAQRAANLTRQLLAFARRQPAAPVPLDLNQALLQMQKVLRRLLGEDVALRIGTQDALWAVKIDPSQVDQILANLAAHAREAIRDVGTVFFATSNVVLDAAAAGAVPDGVPGEYVMLQCSDTGAGMDAEQLAQVFEPFPASPKPEGASGLGLATVFGIVKQNGGFLAVESAVGTGTTFRLYLPRHRGEAESVGRPAETGESPRGNGETILLVEDEELLLELARRTLQKNGYAVLAVRSPQDAIALCRWRKESIDLLLTDVIMPEMNGRDLNAAVQAIRPGLRTLFMSGYPADIIAERGFLEEGVRFLQKPFRPSELIGKVHEILGGT